MKNGNILDKKEKRSVKNGQMIIMKNQKKCMNIVNMMQLYINIKKINISKIKKNDTKRDINIEITGINIRKMSSI